MGKFNEVEELEQLDNLKNEGCNLKKMTEQIIKANKSKKFKTDIYKIQEEQIIEEFKEFTSINALSFEEAEVLRQFVNYQLEKVRK